MKGVLGGTKEVDPARRTRWNRVGRRVPAFQASYAGSIPATRSQRQAVPETGSAASRVLFATHNIRRGNPVATQRMERDLLTQPSYDLTLVLPLLLGLIVAVLELPLAWKLRRKTQREERALRGLDL